LFQIRAYVTIEVEKQMLSARNLLLSSGFDVTEEWLKGDGESLTYHGRRALRDFIVQEMYDKR
jgi:hypothetical protein